MGGEGGMESAPSASGTVPFPGTPLVLRLSAHGCSLLRLSAPGAETQCPWLLPADTQCPLVPRLSARGCSLLRLTAPLC